MNLRTLLIIAGLALPIVAFAILSQTAPMSQKTATVKAPPPPTAEEKAARKAEKEQAATLSGGEAPASSADTIVSDEVAKEASRAQDVPHKEVIAGPMSAPPVVLPNIGENAAPAAPGAGPQQAANAQGEIQVNPASQVPGPSLQEAIEKTKERLGYLEKMHPSEWAEERKRHKNAPPTLAQAKDYNRNRLAKLATMTPQQWEQEKIAAAKRTQRQWDRLPPEKQLENFSRNQAGMMPDTGSMPAVIPQQPVQPVPMQPAALPQ